MPLSHQYHENVRKGGDWPNNYLLETLKFVKKLSLTYVDKKTIFLIFPLVEFLFLLWGIRLCIMVRKAPSEFNESRFISMAIYNEFLLSIFLNVSV